MARPSDPNRKLKEALREAGLPEAIADPKWEEIEARNQADHAWMLERLREFERRGLFGDVQLPRDAQREAFEADQAQGISYPFFATQNSQPVWKISIDRTLKHWQDHSSGKLQADQRRQSAVRAARAKATKR